MIKLRSWHVLSALAAVAIVSVAVAFRSHSDQAVSVSELAQKTHFHGIAVDQGDPSRIYLATHHGLFVLSPQGTATRVSETRDDFMGFTPHPTDPSVLYASGHPSGGGNLGFIASRDGGKSWTQVSEGVGGPVDFHQMVVSRADPARIYGTYGGLQVSRDGGQSWELVRPAPAGLIDLAVSAEDVDTLYAATQSGLLVSKDGGHSWQIASVYQRPATMVETTSGGNAYAFVVETGLLRASGSSSSWSVISDDFGGDYVLHLAADPTDGDHVYAVTLQPETRAQAVLESRDSGRTWALLGSKSN